MYRIWMTRSSGMLRMQSAKGQRCSTVDEGIFESSSAWVKLDTLAGDYAGPGEMLDHTISRYLSVTSGWICVIVYLINIIIPREKITKLKE
jgi:hypothetical protein